MGDCNRGKGRKRPESFRVIVVAVFSSCFVPTRLTGFYFANGTLVDDPVRAGMTLAAAPNQQIRVGLEHDEGVTLRARGDDARCRMH